MAPIRTTIRITLFLTIVGVTAGLPSNSAAQPGQQGPANPAPGLGLSGNEKPPMVSWPEFMAESVMKRTPLVKDEWHYEIGVMLKAFYDLWLATGNDQYLEYVQKNMDAFVQGDGSIRTYDMSDYNLDQINAGKLLFPLYAQTGEEKYRIAIDTLRKQLVHQPRTSEGGFWHKKIYPYQLWLDGVYMAGPFLAKYAVEFDDPTALGDVVHEILLAARYMRDPATGLFYHGWDEKRTQVWADSITGLSPNFWGRAMGWYGMALVDVLDYLPDDDPDWESVVWVLEGWAHAVAGVQDPVTGTWYQVLDKPTFQGNYLEASASSMFVYVLAKGARLGYIDPSYTDVAWRGYQGILHEFVTVENGVANLNQICSVAGLGGAQLRDGSFKYYISEPISSNDAKGVGPFIMAGIELELMN